HVELVQVVGDGRVVEGVHDGDGLARAVAHDAAGEGDLVEAVGVADLGRRVAGRARRNQRGDTVGGVEPVERGGDAGREVSRLQDFEWLERPPPAAGRLRESARSGQSVSESREDAHAIAGHCPAPFDGVARLEMEPTRTSGPVNTLKRDFQGGVILTGMVAIRRPRSDLPRYLS